MRGADASAGTIKSGGATRRAAKMVILDVDHPDIEEFIGTKAERRTRSARCATPGFDMDLGGEDITSRPVPERQQLGAGHGRVHAGGRGGATDTSAHGRLDGEVIKTVDARDLFRQIAQAAWECADPGIQYDDTINDWHTVRRPGRITACNPCFTGDTLVHTDKGLIRFDDLVRRASRASRSASTRNDATDPDAPADRSSHHARAVMVTGTNEIVELEFSDGMVLRCTPNHRIWTGQPWLRRRAAT